MKKIENQNFVGERALFKSHDLEINNCIFHDGESPLKESSNLNITNTTFDWKYPLWYGNNFQVNNSTFTLNARAGIWYSNNLVFQDCKIDAPKLFRRCNHVLIENIKFTNGEETLWHCKNVKLVNVEADKSYFAMDCENLEVDHLILNGNYGFDSCKNIHITNSTLHTKDAFWNCENVTIENSTIVGEYLAWNGKNITLINCHIESLQGLCYIENLKVINCEIVNTPLAFEYCSLDVDVDGIIECVKNPIRGTIKCKNIQELILDDEKIDKSNLHIIYK